MAKQGYTNLFLKSSKNSGDGKEMVEARTNFLTLDYYKPLLNELIVILEARQEVASLQEEIKNQEGKSITLESQIEDHRQKDVTLSLSLHI